MIARTLSRYVEVAIDCVANNVNDLLCVGAEPIALVDYIATDRVEEAAFADIARGLYLGATEAGISIPGGEIAQMGSMLAPEAGGGPALDLVGTAVGIVSVGADGAPAPIDGSAVQPGDRIIGLPSSGLHSNGYSLVRHALF